MLAVVPFACYFAVMRWSHSQKAHVQRAVRWAESLGGSGTSSQAPNGFEIHRLDIDLKGTAVTDADLAFLEGRTDLDYLNLSDTQITDAGLRHLRNAKKLTVLDLRGTQVTTEGVQTLRDALPHLINVSF